MARPITCYPELERVHEQGAVPNYHVWRDDRPAGGDEHHHVGYVLAVTHTGRRGQPVVDGYVLCDTEGQRVKIVQRLLTLQRFLRKHWAVKVGG